MKLGVNTFGLGLYLHEDKEKTWEGLRQAQVDFIEPCIAFHKIVAKDAAFQAVLDRGIFDGVEYAEDMPEYLDMLRGKGFTCRSFQFQETPFDPDEFRRVIPFMKTHGFQYGIYNFMHSSVARIREDADTIRKAVRLFRDEGLELLIHNHDMEWHRDGDTSVMEWLLEHIPELRFEIDLGWTQYAGVDALAVLKKYPDRFPLIHIKEIGRGKTAHTDEAFCVAPGEGILPLEEIILLAMDMPIDGYGMIIDQDDSVSGDIVADIASGISRIQEIVRKANA